MRFEKSQRNGIFKAIEAAGLDPAEFSFDPGEDADSTAWIRHPRSGSYFVLERNGTRYVGRYQAGDSAQWPFLDLSSWGDVESRISGWLRDVKTDVETPDLWAELRGERETLGSTTVATVDNTPFTPEEQTAILEQLQQIKEYVTATYTLPHMEMQAFEERLDYVAAAVSRLGRARG